MSDADTVLTWVEAAGLWQSPLFTEHVAGRIARRLAADRGDRHSFTRVDPYNNWQEYAWHPRRPMPNGKGDYSEWEARQRARRRGSAARAETDDPTRKDEEARESSSVGAPAGLTWPWDIVHRGPPLLSMLSAAAAFDVNRT